MRRLAALYLLASSGCWVLGAHAAETSNLIDLIDGSKVQWQDRAYRLALVTSLESLLTPLHQSIPNPSPEQKAWLEAERARIDAITDRESRLAQLAALSTSSAFLIEKAKQGLDQHLVAIDCIKNPKTPIETEMACWATLSLKLQDSIIFESAQLLRDQRRITVPTKGAVSLITTTKNLAWDHWPRILGHGILAHIVIPYLFSQQRKQ